MKTATELVLSIFGPTPHPFVEAEYELSVEIREDAELRSFVGMTHRWIDIEGGPVEVAGIGFVVTDPAYRRRGLMRQAIEEAHMEAQRRCLRWALLNTGMPYLYESFGYRHANNLPPEWMVCELLAVDWHDSWIVDLKGTW